MEEMRDSEPSILYKMVMIINALYKVVSHSFVVIVIVMYIQLNLLVIKNQENRYC
jgi:uncharacterized membrane protein YhaH (DUF805 family)